MAFVWFADRNTKHVLARPSHTNADNGKDAHVSENVTHITQTPQGACLKDHSKLSKKFCPLGLNLTAADSKCSKNVL